jgi:hypothetical protein
MYPCYDKVPLKLVVSGRVMVGTRFSLCCDTLLSIEIVARNRTLYFEAENDFFP